MFRIICKYDSFAFRVIDIVSILIALQCSVYNNRAKREETVESETNRIRWHDSICVVPPPQIQTVKKTTSRVVENIICRAYVAVSLMDRAKVMAPRRPAEERHTEFIKKKNNSTKGPAFSVSSVTDPRTSSCAGNWT